MAKVVISGNAVVITSAIKYADIEKAKKYRPEALVLKDEEGKKDIFAIGLGKAQQNDDFIVFDGKTHDEEGYATYTALLPASCGDIKGSIADLFGATLIKLGKLEEIFPAAIAEIDAEREAVLSQITLS